MEKEISRKLIAILKKNGAKKASLFGSYSRGTQTKLSDLDVLVSFKESKSLLDLVRIEREASQITGIKVDLLTEKSMSSHILKKVKSQLKVLFS